MDIRTFDKIMSMDFIEKVREYIATTASDERKVSKIAKDADISNSVLDSFKRGVTKNISFSNMASLVNALGGFHFALSLINENDNNLCDSENKEIFFNSLKADLLNFFYQFNQNKEWQEIIASKTGISIDEIHNIVSGVSKDPDFLTITKLMKFLANDFRDFLSLKSKKQLDDKNIKINVYAIAGTCPVFDLQKAKPIDTLEIPKYLAKDIDFSFLFQGHSMEPLIPDKSIVCIKQNFEFIPNEIYAANLPYEGVVIKRVGVNFQKNEYIFKSENSDKIAYPDFRISIEESNRILIGRIVLVVRKM